MLPMWKLMGTAGRQARSYQHSHMVKGRLGMAYLLRQAAILHEYLTMDATRSAELMSGDVIIPAYCSTWAPQQLQNEVDHLTKSAHSLPAVTC